MLLFAGLCIGLGIFYAPLYELLPFTTTYVPYTGAHVLVQLELLLFSGLAFFVMLPLLRRTLTLTLDTDWVYRRFAPVLWTGTATLAGMAMTILRTVFGRAGRGLERFVERHHGVESVLATTWTTGGMALWAAILLAGYLVLYYV